ncbi:MAG TPA: helix-turn-helix transcriptional regulator [Polyangiaceae bacterium]
MAKPPLRIYLTATMCLLWQPFPFPKGHRAFAWHHHPSTRKPAHFHEEPELNLVVRGSATFVVADRRIEMSPGSLQWYPPGLDHYLECASVDLELFVVGFRQELLDAYSREHGSSPNFARQLCTVDERTLSVSSEIFGAAHSSNDAQSAERRLLEILAEFERVGPAPTLGYRAAKLLADSPGRRRDDIVRTLASNRGDVSTRFRHDVGLPIAEYRNRLKTLHLIGLLEAGHDNLLRAAFEAGFGSYSRCHQVIRKTLGIAPSELSDASLRQSFVERFEPMLPPFCDAPSRRQ